MKPRQPPRLDLRDVASMTAPAAVRIVDGRASVEEGAVASGDRLPDCRTLRLERCHLRAAAIPPACTELHVTDCVVSMVDLAASGLADLVVRGSTLDDCRLAGVTARIRIDDARLVRCRLSDASLRMARFDRVELDQCHLDGADFYGAALDGVAFDRCDLRHADLTAAELTRCEIAGCELAGIRGAAALAGTRMSAVDVLGCAVELAVAFGIVVGDA